MGIIASSTTTSYHDDRSWWWRDSELDIHVQERKKDSTAPLASGIKKRKWQEHHDGILLLSQKSLGEKKNRKREKKTYALKGRIPVLLTIGV